MEPTYSFSEIKTLIPSLDFTSINILGELIEEEKQCFTWYELRAIGRFINLKNKDLVQNQVKVEFLLSFN